MTILHDIMEEKRFSVNTLKLSGENNWEQVIVFSENWDVMFSDIKSGAVFPVMHTL